jgi:glycosyltransferase involved in cell wall biosynthesis
VVAAPRRQTADGAGALTRRPAPPRITLLYRDRGEQVDGIRDHTRRLAEALRATGAAGVRIEFAVGPAFATATLRPDDDVLFVQYNPFSYARWGFAPWLPLALLRARRRRRVALMVHEPYVPMRNLRWTVMGAWQRLQLWLLWLSADVVLASIEPWAERLGRWRPRRPVHHLPVGSNLPDRRACREQTRRRLGIAPGEVVLATLGSGSPAWLGERVLAAAAAVAAAGCPASALLLGADAPDVDGLADVVPVRRPGWLSDEDLAATLAAADVFLAPLADGVSTRRTTLMAALQHAVPVVATRGPLTDSELVAAGDALRLVPVTRAELFAQATLALAEDPAARLRVGRAGRSLYDRAFSWERTAAQLLRVLGPPAAGPPSRALLPLADDR